MPNTSSRFVRALALVALFAAAPASSAFAQDEQAAPITPETVVATVNGEPITEAELSFAAEDMAQELAQMQPAQRRPFLLRVMIDMKVMSGAAREAGMDQTELFAQRQQYLEERALRRAFFADAIAAAVTQETVRAEYDAYVSGFAPEDEIRASHILVEDEELAKSLKTQIDGGADFATLARENSIDPGAANGGDLGFFSRGMMVPPFEAAAFELAEAGDISDPVQSNFGWHIIQLTDKRQSSPPAYEQVAPQIQQQLLMKTFNDKVEELMSGADIDIADTELAAALAALDAGEPVPEEAEAAGQ